jgi:hypothetical protein
MGLVELVTSNFSTIGLLAAGAISLLGYFKYQKYTIAKLKSQLARTTDDLQLAPLQSQASNLDKEIEDADKARILAEKDYNSTSYSSLDSGGEGEWRPGSGTLPKRY